MQFDAGHWHEALLHDEVALFGAPRDAARFSVHRHNVRHALLGAIQAAFPVLRARLGEARFTALAVAFIRTHPPASPVLSEYGAGFGNFLDGEGCMPSLPWRGDLARLEWACREAFHAADSTPLALDALRAIPLPALLRSHFILGPSLRLLASPHPVFEYWHGAIPSAGAIDGQAQAVQVWRHDGSVHVRPLAAGSHALLNALRCGRSLLQALYAAQSLDRGFEPVQALTRLFEDHLIDRHLPPFDLEP